MPQEQQLLNASNAIVDPDRTPTQVMREWALRVSNNSPIVNTGSPEGNVLAPQYTLYIDETVPTAPVQYRKMLPEIGGDRKKGWIAL